ncbi:uncharacterized protein BJ171DRAFT_5713 [Polychytrium aggregatum]|uniref:uncharacterized protein n=1 Tax=Polychytrium aggregatum TaxID=110093 RepID=UPI0022FE6DA6|nr:uncharacterized protein BJ171DRAFT_5713 [Polychytrium aggregatum]KAI9209678.1 hypothetical protein BJ171DRAFT_5713 [Polychytrium aggregatum]
MGLWISRTKNRGSPPSVAVLPAAGYRGEGHGCHRYRLRLERSRAPESYPEQYGGHIQPIRLRFSLYDRAADTALPRPALCIMPHRPPISAGVGPVPGAASIDTVALAGDALGRHARPLATSTRGHRRRSAYVAFHQSGLVLGFLTSSETPGFPGSFARAMRQPISSAQPGPCHLSWLAWLAGRRADSVGNLATDNGGFRCPSDPITPSHGEPVSSVFCSSFYSICLGPSARYCLRGLQMK